MAEAKQKDNKTTEKALGDSKTPVEILEEENAALQLKVAAAEGIAIKNANFEVKSKVGEIIKHKGKKYKCNADMCTLSAVTIVIAHADGDAIDNILAVEGQGILEEQK